MAIYGVYNGGAEHTLRYRFTCAKCGRQTDWLEYEVRVGYNVRVSGSYSLDALKKGEQAALSKKIEHMKKSMAKGHLFDSSFMAKTEDFYSLDRKCPYCGAKQPNKGVSVEYDWNGR